MLTFRCPKYEFEAQNTLCILLVYNINPQLTSLSKLTVIVTLIWNGNRIL